MFDLSGTIGVVTGSNRGIGLGIARAFLENGALVAISGLDELETRDAAASLADIYGDRVTGLAGDVSSADFCEAILTHVTETFGQPGVVVCNAGIGIIKPALEYAVTEWDRILDVNLKGAFLMAQAP